MTALSVSTLREESIQRILDIIGAYEISKIKTVNKARKQLETYSDSTIEIILQGALHENSRHDLMIAVMNQTDEKTVREVMFLHPYTPAKAATAYHNLVGIIRGLHQIDHFKNTSNLETLTGEDLSIAVAFIDITCIIKRHFAQNHLTTSSPQHLATVSIHIGNREVQNLIIEHYREMERVLCFIRDENPYFARLAISGLPHLRWYKEQSVGTVTGETIDRAMSYLRITAALSAHTDYENLTLSGVEDWNLEGRYLCNEEFEHIVDQHYRRADEIIGYVRERGSATPEEIRHYLENHVALQNGVL